MLGKILVICSVFLVCYSQTARDNDWDRYPVKKPHHHHHYDPYYLLYSGGFLYYLAFLLIKFKIIFVVGVIIVGVLFAGKLFALIKYSEYIKSSDHHHHHKPEKIYIESAPSIPHHHHHDVIPYNSPPSSIGGYETLPPNAQIDYGPNRRQILYKTN